MAHGRLRWQASSYTNAYSRLFCGYAKPVGAGLPAKVFSLALHDARPSSLASQLLHKRVLTIILWIRKTCRSRLAGEGVFIGAARRMAAFAGKPAPTRMCTRRFG